MQIGPKTVVSIDYTLTDDNGQLLDSSEGQGPLTYLHGAGNIISGLESALEGQGEGESVSVRLDPKDAYGVRDENQVQDIPRTAFGDNEVQEGAQYRATTPQGEPLVLTVVSAGNDQVTVDANHPLAGVPLNFEVSVREIREATNDEVEHGHVHGPDGEHHDH